ncbi:MAG: hypothetical protein WDM89_19800 [Rhizomicrobium sp.]
MPDNFCTTTSRENLLARAEGLALRHRLEDTDSQLDSFFRVGERTIPANDSTHTWEASFFVPAEISARNPRAIPILLNTIASYLNDLKGSTNRQISLILVVERGSDGTCRKLTYRGGIAGLSGLAAQVEAVAQG